MHEFPSLLYSGFSDIIHSLKPNFTKEYKKLIELPPSKSIKFWQKRFWDHVIRDDRDFENHLHYIHFNPVKHGLVKDPCDWKDSSYIEWERLAYIRLLSSGMSRMILIGVSSSCFQRDNSNFTI